jgi:hypothetical protein
VDEGKGDGEERWLADRLHMGAETGVSRYVGELLRHKTGEGYELYLKLSAKMKG